MEQEPPLPHVLLHGQPGGLQHGRQRHQDVGEPDACVCRCGAPEEGGLLRAEAGRRGGLPAVHVISGLHFQFLGDRW